MELVLQIAVALFLAKILGELAERAKMPSLIGYLATGVILMQINFIDPHTVELFGIIGLILLLFLAAFEEANTEELLKNKFVSIFFGVGGVIISMSLGILVSRLFGLDWLGSILIGTGLAATSISVSLGTFISTGKLNTKVGRAVLGSAIVDDVLALVILAIVAGIAVSGTLTLSGILTIVGGLLAFIVLIILMVKFFPQIMKLVKIMRVEEAIFSIVIVFVLLVAFAAEKLGLSSVIGAFFAGMVLSKIPTLETKQFVNKLSAVSYGLFIPFFFIWVGTEMQFSTTAFSWFTVALIVVAVVGKMLSAFIGYKITSFNLRELLIIGIARIPRGEVMLVIVSIGVSVGIISKDIFSAILMLIVLTIVVTPLILTSLLKSTKLE